MFTNIPGAGAQATITISGEVWQPVEVSPRTASFGRMTLEQAEKGPLVRKVTIVNNMDEPMSLTNLRSSNPVFRVETREIEAGKKIEMTITLVPPLKQGSNYARIEASTGVSEQPSLLFNASVYVAPEVAVTPRQIVLGAARRALTTRFIYVRNSGTRTVKVTEAKSSNPAITADIGPVGNGKNVKITVKIPKDCTISPQGETLTILTDHPSFASFQIPIRITPTSPRGRTAVRPSASSVKIRGANPSTGLARGTAATLKKAAAAQKPANTGAAATPNAAKAKPAGKQ